MKIQNYNTMPVFMVSYAECCDECLALTIVILNGVMFSVIELSAVMLNVIIPSVIMLNVFTPGVVRPFLGAVKMQRTKIIFNQQTSKLRGCVSQDV
jgi:hypothetical protein